MKKPLVSDSEFRYKEQDHEYHGEQLDERYGDGPQNQRSCTDLLCCIIFLAFMVGLIYVAVVAFSSGNPQYLIYPFDKTGKQCKFSKGYEQYPFIYIASFGTEPYFVCVKNCPTKDAPDGSVLECKIGQGSIISSCSQLNSIYASKQLATYCFPEDKAKQIAGKLIRDILSIGVLQTYFSDLAVGWQLLCWMLCVALVISVLYSFLIRFCAGCMVWTMIIALQILLLALGMGAILIVADVRFVKTIVNYDSLPDTLKDPTYLKVVGGLCLFLFVVSGLIVCCMCKQIRISIGILKAAADFVRQCCSAFFIPLYITILQLIFLAFWVTVILFLFSSNTGTVEQFQGTPFGMVVWNQHNQYLIIFYLFGLLWFINFLSGCECFWVSSTAAIWYFQQGEPTAPVIRSFCRIFYHLGSIAFGSLLIAIILFIRIILEFLTNQLKQKTLGMSQGKVVGFALRCVACLIACFQRIIRFITQNAYIMIAITGKNFCTSAKDSFYLMIRSASQFFISHGTTKLFIIMGTNLIITFCCFIGYIFITNISPYKQQIKSPVFMTILFALTALPVAWAFMEFYEKAANTILMCYCVQLDLAKSNKKCPIALKNFMEDYVHSMSQDR